MKLKYRILLFVLSVLTIWLIAIQFKTYKYPDPNEINKRLNYLERVINQPLDNNSEIMKLRYESYEFMLFSYAYSTYALTNLAVKDAAYKERANRLIKASILKVLEPEIYSSYGIEQSLTGMDSIPYYSVLYLGHLNLMLGCYRLLSDDESFNSLNDRISKSLFNRYNKTHFLCFESYPSSIWIPDNTVAVASLKLHSANTGSSYNSICKKWVEYARTHFLDAETDTLYSTVNPENGEPVEEPRGSMLGWSIMYIYQFDSEFAIELYENYRKHFSSDILIFRLFKERSGNSDINMGDIDSGPVFLGYSIPANEFALSGAVLASDFKVARKLERLINFGASTKENNNEMKYEMRFINMSISPMAEALMLNSLTITRWVNN